MIPQNPVIQGKGKERELLSSSDEFGDDSMDLDPEFLAGLDTVEREAYSRTEKMVTAPSAMSSRPGSLALGGRSQSSALGGRPATSRNAGPAIDVITIEDDEDDKENFPVPTRHVRRRTDDGGGPPSQRARDDGRPIILARAASDVIELSDSD
jgi:RecQ-mediated genome instability protein 1